MLSVVDLIEAGTIVPELAAYALAAIRGGASFLVGAMPGGAGKTTVMGALLNCVPEDVELVAADRLATIERGLSLRQRCCHVCHEIGDGPYYAYLWGKSLRVYFELPEAGHMLATNLHADTYDQARDQICGENGVSQTRFRRMNLMIFLSIGRDRHGYRRRIGEVWESDGTCDHRCVFNTDAGLRIDDGTTLATPDQLRCSAEIIRQLTASDARTIEEVRAFIKDKCYR